MQLTLLYFVPPPPGFLWAALQALPSHSQLLGLELFGLHRTRARGLGGERQGMTRTRLSVWAWLIQRGMGGRAIAILE